CAGPFQTILTPNLSPAAAAPACTETQKSADVPFGMTAIVFLPRLPHAINATRADSKTVRPTLLRTPSSVNDDIGSRNERCLFRTEEQREFAHFFQTSPAA